ncbi:hypothetical protein EVAR_64957_1 [Eumeta japonica]|uniref:Uncharacterized protein n=1 Tax=Eumeta variegata TaxID=151549 RepID=A0A4C1ZMS2_EUMVA|nr:hypothetical protein EVAR_64957_1 [Eumeta japonica]
MGKTNAEYCKEYYYRKKAAKAAEKQEAGLLVERPIRKTGAERNRAYKLRKKMLAQANQSSVNEILSAPSTSNSQIMTSGPPSQPVTTERNMPRRRTLTGHKERVHHRLLQRQIRNQQKQHFHQDEAHFPEFSSDFEDNVVIKKENMMSDVTIKQELDIEPIVLQPRSKPGLCPPTGYGPKTAAERCRAYWERKKKAENKPQDAAVDDNVTAAEYMTDDGNEGEIMMNEIMKA